MGEAHVGAGCAAAAYDDAPGVHDAGRRGGVFNGGPVRAFEENCPDAFRGWSGEKFGLSGSCFGAMQPCSDLTFGESSVAEKPGRWLFFGNWPDFLVQQKNLLRKKRLSFRKSLEETFFFFFPAIESNEFFTTNI